MSVMYERVVQIVSKPPEKRKDQEVEMMLPWFRKKAAVFSQLSTEVIADIIRNCQFITVQRDHVIIKQGDVGDCFYIILRGKVSIFINNLISDEDDENLLAEQTQELLKNPKTGKGELDRSKFGNCIAPLDEGKSFGELALISKDCVRNASIIADQTTDLVVVNRDLYNRSLRAEQEADLNERNSFVTDNPLFRYWAHRYKKQMAFSIKKEVVPFDGIIAKQGDPVDCIYFIQKGQAKIVVEPSLHETQYPNLHPMEQEQAKPEEEEDFVIPLRKETTALGEATTTPSAGRRKESRRKAMELSIVGKNEIIGDVEFVLDLKTYIQSVIATQPCQLFSLDLKNYERLVVRKNAKTVQMIREQAEMKISCRLKRLPERAVPLLRVLSNKLQSFNKPSSSKAKQHKPVIYSSRFSDIVPQRGAIVDLFGPGTIFYRNRMREKARNKAANKGAQFRGANVGFRLRLAQNVAHGDNGGAYYDDPGSGLFASHDPFMSATAGGGAMGAHEHQQEDDQEHTPEIEPLEKNTFKDYQSCDRVLTNLEGRIKAWHSIMREGNNKRAKPQAVKLHRLSLDENMQLKPGKKVIFQRRQIRGPKLPNQPLDNEDERDDEPITGQETTSKSRIEPPAYIIKQQGSRYPGDHEEQAMSTVHGARVPGTQEAAAMAPASSHNIFITSPASHMHQQQQQQHPHQQQQHPHQQQHQQQHLYDDDTVFNRQKAMPETHALSIVCGSVDHNHKSPYNHGYNSNRLQPIIPPSTDHATDTGTASRRKSADSGRCSPSSWSSSSSGGQNTKKKSKSKKKTLSAPKESAKNLSRSWPR